MATLTFIPGRNRQRLAAALWLTMSTLAGTIAFAQESEFAGLVRGKTPDRGTYQPPSLPQRSSMPEEDASDQRQEPIYEGDNEGDLADDFETYAETESGGEVIQASYQPRRSQPPRVIRRAGHVHQPTPVYEQTYPSHQSYGLATVYEPACGLEAVACDSGCDSMCGGCDTCGGRTHVGPLGLFHHTNQWFGAAELMLMFRSGDTLPVLATGASNRVLFGGERYYKDMTAGGRFKLGTWLDPYHCNSLVFRGWGAGKESFGFRVDDSQSEIIDRPFLNVRPGEEGQTTLAIAGPTAGINGDRLTGELQITGGSKVYGGDIAIHRQWQAGLGGVVEVLYGYQHMRLNEDLGIASTSFDPGATVINYREHFEANNEFHGGEFGLATRYREGCWSFDGMIKVAAGSIKRTATLEGESTFGDSLLVRTSNRGKFSNSTFGWIPELDATIGYRYTQNLDFTIGYHVIAMTDALQVSGVLDPQLAVNSALPSPQPARPSFNARYDTFYVQSIHFGLQYVY